jgi:hypothetical protein
VGGHHPIIWGGEWNHTQKNMKYIVAFGGRQLMIRTQQPTKNMHTQWMVVWMRGANGGRAWGGYKSIVLAAIELEE